MNDLSESDVLLKEMSTLWIKKCDYCKIIFEKSNAWQCKTAIKWNPFQIRNRVMKCCLKNNYLKIISAFNFLS